MALTRDALRRKMEDSMSTVRTVPPRDLYITPELHRRVPREVDHPGEKLALQDIEAQMLDHPDQLLPKLVEHVSAILECLGQHIPPRSASADLALSIFQGLPLFFRHFRLNLASRLSPVFVCAPLHAAIRLPEFIGPSPDTLFHGLRLHS
ncbi:hypothetical protein CI15_25650 [Paraburkholderia monticola]|uniref:Uncharacterized protein n=1 Tax=Paraburkholderia monticola TaxID=1399968 RepID=A0A149PFY2_9BURK|nr:hypothetical protein [Paraburkholderia monticola]KXU83912.1 hypothetical protein CI15_25650 [Paraburkholderia monticola]